MKNNRMKKLSEASLAALSGKDLYGGKQGGQSETMTNATNDADATLDGTSTH